MINPLELRVSLQALPEMAPMAHQEQAGALYRQVRELGAAREESLNRPEQVVNVANKSGTTFYAVENPGESSGRKEEAEERLRERRREMSNRITYEPFGQRSIGRGFTNDDMLGNAFDYVI